MPITSDSRSLLNCRWNLSDNTRVPTALARRAFDRVRWPRRTGRSVLSAIRSWFNLGMAGEDPNGTKLYLLKIELSGNRDRDHVWSRVYTGDGILNLDPNDESTADWIDHGSTNDLDLRRANDLLYLRYEDAGITRGDVVSEGPFDETRFADTWAALILLPEPATLTLLSLGALLSLERRWRENRCMC